MVLALAKGEKKQCDSISFGFCSFFFLDELGHDFFFIFITK